jgi:hypothetical protein
MTNENFNWDKIAEAKGDSKYQIAQAYIDASEYINLTDVLLNRERGASIVLELLDRKYGCGKGVIQPSPLGEFKIKPYRAFAKDGSFEYRPGDVVEWKQQIYNRAPLGSLKGASKKKLTLDERHRWERRGDGDKLNDTGRAVVGPDGCITVSYQDATQMLYTAGKVRRGDRCFGICEKEEFSKKQIRHQTEENKLIWQTRNNWLYEEIAPDSERDKKAEEPQRGNNERKR